MARVAQVAVPATVELVNGTAGPNVPSDGTGGTGRTATSQHAGGEDAGRRGGQQPPCHSRAARRPWWDPHESTTERIWEVSCPTKEEPSALPAPGSPFKITRV